MRALAALITATVVAAVVPFQANADGKARWSHNGPLGPQAWARLDPSYATCARGRRQSPIDLRNFTRTDLPSLQFEYWEGATRLEHNGHTVRVGFPGGNNIHLDGTFYALDEVHFHAPAEHQLHGKRYPLEAHFVHRSAKGKLAVVAVMYQYGEADPDLDDLGTRWPDHLGYGWQLPDRPRPLYLLPESHEYYRYTGSLTTPPCTESVEWLVMKSLKSVSREQVKRVDRAMGGHNHRGVQPRNARLLLGNP